MSPGKQVPTVNRVNDTAFQAMNLVYGLAARFPYVESYLQLEELALRVQNEIAEAGCAAIRADRERRAAS